MPDSKPLILIDGSSWLYRAFHALPPLTNSRGEATGAVLGMGNMLRKLLREYEPERIAVIFDPRGKTFRNDIYADYKANRPPVPEELASQFPVIRELIEAMGLPLIQISGVEADDVIGTLAVQEKGEVLIVTGDKDMAQLVNERIKLLDTMKGKLTDTPAVEEKFGVGPARITDLLALMGDSSDNIPGVPKVGPKTAAKWLNEFGDLDTLIKRAEEVSGKVGESLREHLEQLPMAKDLATIRTELELELEDGSLRPGTQDDSRFRELCERYEFRQWLRDFEDSAATDESAAEPIAAKTEGQYHTILTQEELDTLIRKLEKAELICIDTETDSLDAMQANLVGLSFCVEPGEAWYIPVAHDYLGAPKQLSRDMVLDALRPVLEDPKRAKLGQHIKYDLNVLACHGVEVRGVSEDSMLASYVYNSTATRHDMDSLALKYLGAKTIKFEEVAGKGKNQITFNQVSLEQATPYAAEDVDITLQLQQTLAAELAKTPSLEKVYRDIEVPLIPVLSRIERNGVLLDTSLLGRISKEMASRMEELTDQAFAAAGGDFNLNSPAQLQEILFDKLQLPVVRKTPKGQPSTAEDVLEELADQHDLPRLILDYRALAKLRSTYTEKLGEQVNPKTGRVHTSYHQAVAATGRLSSSDPNLQNIPVRRAEGRRIRQAFIAPEGCKLVSIDYSQIELRLMAHFSGDQSLLDAFQEGLDIHRATASEIFDVALDKVTDDQRRAAKTINFGLIYGMSAFGLAKQLNIPRNEAGEYIQRFFERYPGVLNFMENTKEGARKTGYVETLYGRRLYLPEINAKNPQHRQYAERTAINAPLQGTAADLIKKAMIDVHTWLENHATDTRIIMQVHDELVFEIPEKQAESLGHSLAERMCAVGELKVPLVAEPGMGDNWDAAH